MEDKVFSKWVDSGMLYGLEENDQHILAEQLEDVARRMIKLQSFTPITPRIDFLTIPIVRRIFIEKRKRGLADVSLNIYNLFFQLRKYSSTSKFIKLDNSVFFRKLPGLNVHGIEIAIGRSGRADAEIVFCGDFVNCYLENEKH